MDENTNAPIDNAPEADGYYGESVETDEIDMSFLDEKSE